MSINTVKRVNISLPVATLEKIDTITKRGDRSRFIDQAVHFYVAAFGKKQLRQSLMEGALLNAARDQEVASEWFLLEESRWPNNV